MRLVSRGREGRQATQGHQGGEGHSTGSCKRLECLIIGYNIID